MALTRKLVLVDLFEQGLALQYFQYEDVLTLPGFHGLRLTFSPFYFSIHMLSHKANTASVHQVLVCIHCSCPSTLHTDMSLWLPHSHE